MEEPDRFSLPSGHAAAVMSIAIGYSLVFPSLSAPLVAAAVVVGMSRVVLAVHYPGAVVAGQCIAVLTAVVTGAELDYRGQSRNSKRFVTSDFRGVEAFRALRAYRGTSPGATFVTVLASLHP